MSSLEIEAEKEVSLESPYEDLRLRSLLSQPYSFSFSSGQAGGSGLKSSCSAPALHEGLKS